MRGEGGSIWPVRLRVSWAAVAALLLAAIFVAAILSVIDYPFGLAWDEPIKVQGIRTGRYRYYHPLLMIDLAQAAAFVLQPADVQAYIDIGRVLAAVAGGLLVFGTFMLARLVLPDLPALAATAAVAVTPLVTVHARIFKEDIFVAAFLVLSLAALIRLLRAPAPHRAILLGIFAGLAAGSKYIGALIVSFAVLAILLVPTPGPRRRLVRAATVTGISLGTFLLLMLPAIRRLERWQKHLSFEFTHSLAGHDVPLPVWQTSGIFHLRESLLPGLGTPLLLGGLIGLAAPLVAAPERRMPLGLIAVFTVLWYLVHEASPLKPYPDFARYMLPLVPLLVILAVSFLYELLSRRDRLGAAAAIAVLLAAAPALWTSVRTNFPDDDPRSIVPPILEATGARVVIDRYADYNRTRKMIGDARLRPTRETADIVMTANLTYDRFDGYAAPEPGSAVAGGLLSRAQRTASSRSVEWTADHGLFQSGPAHCRHGTSVDRLKQIEAAIAAAAPGLSLQLIEGRSQN